MWCPSHKLLLRVSLLPICCKGHGNSREIPDTTLSMAHETHTRTGTLTLTESLRGSLSNHDSDGNGNENGKREIYGINRQNNFASACHFLFFFCLSLFFLYDFFSETTTWKFLNQTIFFSFSELRYSPLDVKETPTKSTDLNFDIEQGGLITMTFGTGPVHFLSDVFAVVVDVVA